MKKYKVVVCVDEAYFVYGENISDAERNALEAMWNRGDIAITATPFDNNDPEYSGEFGDD